MRRISALFILICIGWACGDTATNNRSENMVNSEQADGGPQGQIYLRTHMWVNSFGSTLDISWIWLGEDGTIIKNPKHGVNPVNLDAERRDNGDYTGTYTVEGDRMKIIWQDGKTADWRVEFDGSKMKALDGGITVEQEPLSDDFRLDGKYATGAVVPNASASSTLTFSPDGKFSQSDFMGVSTPEDTATSQSGAQGTYRISGNTLILNYSSGEKLVAVITLWKLADGKTHLVINQNSYPQEN